MQTSLNLTLWVSCSHAISYHQHGLALLRISSFLRNFHKSPFSHRKDRVGREIKIPQSSVCVIWHLAGQEKPISPADTLRGLLRPGRIAALTLSSLSGPAFLLPAAVSSLYCYCFPGHSSLVLWAQRKQKSKLQGHFSEIRCQQYLLEIRTFVTHIFIIKKQNVRSLKNFFIHLSAC